MMLGIFATLCLFLDLAVIIILGYKRRKSQRRVQGLVSAIDRCPDTKISGDNKSKALTY